MSRPCKVAGCDREAHRGDECSLHYQRIRKHGTYDPPPAKPTICCIEGCGKKHYGSLLCNMHYMRLRRHGTTDIVPTKATLCEALGCKTETTHKLCKLHYTRMQRHGDPNAKVNSWEPRKSDYCTIDGCAGEYFARHVCWHHYYAMNRDGSADRHRAKMRKHYRENRDYYTVRSQRRLRNMTDGMTEQELAESFQRRREIRDNPCFYCGGPGEHYDHFYPVVKGGTDRAENLVRACAQCNWRKGGNCGTWFRLKAIHATRAEAS